MAAAKPTIGYLGLGIMGSAMAGRLLDAGFDLTIYNRTRGRCSALEAKGAKVADSPKALVEKCDIVFACTSDPASAKAVFFGENGVLAGITPGKKFVDMSTVNVETVLEIGKAVTEKGGIYLEAPVAGSKGPALNGQLVILSAGDQKLKEEAQPCFDILGKKTYFLGEMGGGARMKLVINMMMGINMVALAEGLAVGQKAGLNGSDIIDVIKDSAIASPMYGLKGPLMLAGNFAPNFPLKHEQKDMRLAVEMGDQVGQPLPLAAATNEAFKASIADGRGDEDFSAVVDSVKRVRR